MAPFSVKQRCYKIVPSGGDDLFTHGLAPCCCIILKSNSQHLLSHVDSGYGRPQDGRIPNNKAMALLNELLGNFKEKPHAFIIPGEDAFRDSFQDGLYKALTTACEGLKQLKRISESTPKDDWKNDSVMLKANGDITANVTKKMRNITQCGTEFENPLDP